MMMHWTWRLFQCNVAAWGAEALRPCAGRSCIVPAELRLPPSPLTGATFPVLGYHQHQLFQHGLIDRDGCIECSLPPHRMTIDCNPGSKQACDWTSAGRRRLPTFLIPRHHRAPGVSGNDATLLRLFL